MKVSSLTRMLIRTQPVKVAATGVNGAWCGWIMTDTPEPRPLLSTEPIYVSPGAAEQAMADLVEILLWDPRTSATEVA